MDVSPSAMRSVELAGWICRRRAKGASFCQVDRISPVVRSNPCRTSGSQECRGARPTFRARARVISVTGRGCDIC